jgi:hypothetical protein
MKADASENTQCMFFSGDSPKINQCNHGKNALPEFAW